MPNVAQTQWINGVSRSIPHIPIQIHPPSLPYRIPRQPPFGCAYVVRAVFSRQPRCAVGVGATRAGCGYESKGVRPRRAFSGRCGWPPRARHGRRRGRAMPGGRCSDDGRGRHGGTVDAELAAKRGRSAGEREPGHRARRPRHRRAGMPSAACVLLLLFRAGGRVGAVLAPRGTDHARPPRARRARGRSRPAAGPPPWGVTMAGPQAPRSGPQGGHRRGPRLGTAPAKCGPNEAETGGGADGGQGAQRRAGPSGPEPRPQPPPARPRARGRPEPAGRRRGSGWG